MTRSPLLLLLLPALLFGCPRRATPTRTPAQAAPPSSSPSAKPTASPEAIPGLGEPLPSAAKPRRIALGTRPALERSQTLEARCFGREGPGDGAFVYPRALACGADGGLYVMDRTGRIQRFDPGGRVVATVRIPTLKRGTPTGLAIGPGGRVYCGDSHEGRVLVYSPELELERCFGKPGKEPGDFTLITDVCSDGVELIATLDHGDGIARVQVFDGVGKPRACFGKYGMLEGEFRRPMGLCIDRRRSEIIVADGANHRLQIFDLTGKHKRSIGSLGDRPGEINYPYAVAVDSEGRLYVAEFGNHRVQVFDSKGESLALYGRPGRGPGELAYPWDLELSREGFLLLLDSGNHRIVELRRERLLSGR